MVIGILEKPDEVTVFRKHRDPNTNILGIPLISFHRRLTDKKYLIILISTTLILIPFLVYSLLYSDIRRLNGYDECGNICGYRNEPEDVYCTGKDYKLLEFFVENELDGTRVCKPTCEKVNSIFRYVCHFEAYTQFKYIEETLIEAWWMVIVSGLISLALGTIFFVSFRFCVAGVIWSTLFLTSGFLLVLSIFLWYLFFTEGYFTMEYILGWFKWIISPRMYKSTKHALYLALIVIITIWTLFLIGMIIYLFKKIKLIVQLFREAIKAIFVSFRIILIPILGSIFHVLITAVFIFGLLLLETSGILTKVEKPYNYYDYVPNPLMYVALILWIVMFIWYTQFFFGLQYATVSHEVASWYFSSNKLHVESSIGSSFKVIFRYHLGSISIGSLVLSAWCFIGQILRLLASSENLRAMLDCWGSGLARYVECTSKNAYVVTAIHGEPFFKSGRRAARLLGTNSIDLTAINFLGNCVLATSLAAIVLIALTISGIMFFALDIPVNVFHPMLLMGMVQALLIVTCFFKVIEAAIDTIFICYCEDVLLNDGIERPYAMPLSLKQFIDDTKPVFKQR